MERCTSEGPVGLLTDKDLEEYRAEIRGYSTSINMLLALTQL
jgi:hypothetical protein